MGHKNKESLIFQVTKKFNGMLAIGESRHKAKADGTASDKIFSWGTYHTYIKHSCYFINYCKKNYKVKTLEQCESYATEWLNSRSNLSSYTQKMESAALNKLFCKCINYNKRNRSRSNITRSRGVAQRDLHFSEFKNKELVNFAKATGLRRNELKNLKSGSIKYDDTGRACINVSSGTKGGKHRLAPILGDSRQVQRIIDKVNNTQLGQKVFPNISNAADIHSYRSEYAVNYYNECLKSLGGISKYKRNRYYCRKDLKGKCYDKRAMKMVSKALGHNRISVIAEHYLR